MSQRRVALRAYFLEVARDLALRGVIRKKVGHSIDDILKSEPRTVLREVSEDFAAVAGELGLDFLQGGAKMAAVIDHPLASVAAAGLQAFADMFKKKP